LSLIGCIILFGNLKIIDLASVYNLHHELNWVNRDKNQKICRKKQLEKAFICMNGLKNELDKIMLSIIICCRNKSISRELADNEKISLT
jgi:hypothetical protein